LYPSAAPETFSFTLSEAWAAGRPVVVPPIGALAERVEGSGAGWVWADGEWRSEAAMLARIAELLARARAGALAEAARCARAMPQPALADMAQRTLALYDAACVGGDLPPGPPEGRGFPAERVRPALAHFAQSPPARAVAAAADGKQVPVVGAKKGWRSTLVGRALCRAMPAAVRNALRRKPN
jgi:hypothetical protein